MPTTRQKIFQDRLPIDGDWKYVKLEAGWNGALSQIFMGRILQAYSSKNGGDVDIVTHIECRPLDVFDSYTSVTVEKGTSFKDAYKQIASDMKDVEIGHIGTLEGTLQSPTTFEGNTIDCLNQLTGGNTFVDNGVLNTIMSNEVIDVQIPLITDDNGLLSSPERRDATLSIKMLFEPTLIVGQLMEIRSKIMPEYNGQFKVIGFTHDCTISPTQSGSRTTTIDLHIAPLLLGQNINQTEGQPTGGAAPVGGYNVVSGENVVPASGVTPTWIMPCNAPITSPFDMRTHPILKNYTKHNGVDFGAALGTPVKAPAAGKIIFARYQDPNGNKVSIDHGKVNGKSVRSTSIHLQSIAVKEEQYVKQGDIIGTVGSTGKYPDGTSSSTGPHLHISIYENNEPVDPFKYINKSKY